MEVIKEIVSKEEFSESICIEEGALFVDIETTGLNRRYHTIYLIGTAYYNEERDAVITLFFAENTDEEPDILAAFFRLAERFSVIYTFNGTTFDLPFIEARRQKCGLSSSLSQKSSTDLYRVMKKRKDILGLPGCHQKDIEAFLSVARVDEMSGKELIAVYQRFVKSRHDEDHALLIQHNLDDIRGMLRILPMLLYEKLAGVHLSAPSAETDTAENRWILSAKMDLSVPKAVRYRTKEYYLILSENTVKCAFLLHGNKIRHYWDRPCDYVYLLTEERVVLKTLAGGVPKTEKRAAKPEECYTEVVIDDPQRPAEEFFCGYLEAMVRKLFS